MDETLERFEHELRLHILGSFALLQEAAKRMRTAKAGRIIGITTAALDPALRAKRMGSYLVGKATLEAILRELAKELAGDGITVNAVAPGFMAGGLNKDLPERMTDFVKEANPMKTLVTPQDVAAAVAFLCSPDARAITGISLPVTAGELMTL
jgi:3-oxoacyl-[acyl-carrier protein] reductase